MHKRETAVSRVLEDVVQNHLNDRISIFEIKNSLHERGFGLLMILFSLPACIPVPGLSSLPAIPLMIFSVQMIYGADSPWLPEWLGKITIMRSTLAKTLEKAAPHIKTVEKFLKPRFFFLSSGNGEKIIGFICFLCSLSILTPLPMTHSIPGAGILLMSFGLLSRDGIVIILGMITSFIGLTLSTIVILLGTKAVTTLLDKIIYIGN